MITKDDFIIKGRFTGNQIRGREHQFLYSIYTKDGKLLTDERFTSKKEAQKFLSAVIRRYNELKNQLG